MAHLTVASAFIFFFFLFRFFIMFGCSCFLRGRCPMEMWCPDDKVAGLGVGHLPDKESMIQLPEVGWQLLAAENGTSPDCCCCFCFWILFFVGVLDAFLTDVSGHKRKLTKLNMWPNAWESNSWRQRHAPHLCLTQVPKKRWPGHRHPSRCMSCSMQHLRTEQVTARYKLVAAMSRFQVRTARGSPRR